MSAEMSDVDPVEVQRLFKQRRRNQLLLMLPALGSFALLMAAEGKTELGGIPYDALMALVAVLILCVGLFSFFNWRCPACKRYLGRSLFAKFCSGCGAKFC